MVCWGALTRVSLLAHEVTAVCCATPHVLDGAFDIIDGSMLNYGVGFIAAFLTGILACTWMIKLVKKSKLKYFAYYCLVVGVAAIVYSLV